MNAEELAAALRTCSPEERLERLMRPFGLSAEEVAQGDAWQPLLSFQEHLRRRIRPCIFVLQETIDPDFQLLTPFTPHADVGGVLRVHTRLTMEQLAGPSPF